MELNENMKTMMQYMKTMNDAMNEMKTMNDSINGTLKEANHRMEGVKGEVVQVKEDVSTLNKR
eukprot:9385433-Heterocapsa_arctica.AAC.1